MDRQGRVAGALAVPKALAQITCGDRREHWLSTDITPGDCTLLATLFTVTSSPLMFCPVLDPNWSNLTLIDFGLARAYCEPKTASSYCLQKTSPCSLVTTCFASIRALRGRQQSRRDDLELVGYILIYLLCGALPWQDDDPIPEIIQSKANICQSSLHESIPPEFFLLLKYTRSLAFDAHPDYNFIRSYFDRFHMDSLTAANWGDI
ncbi:kinase-like domain-containing protein [Boletus coccyginus]|nr:kinase-like domain-containing protein [Boletus coccyginus]